MTDQTTPPQREGLETFLPEEFDEAEYKLNNRVRVTTQVESFTTEVYTGLRWIPVHEYVAALLAQTQKDTITRVLTLVHDKKPATRDESAVDRYEQRLEYELTKELENLA
jgi:hypothetical protein